MGFFNNLFNKENKTTNPAIQQPENKPAYKTEQELIAAYGGIALEKQMDLGDVIGSNSWNADMTKGTISFGENLTFPIQVLGTYSHSSQTWLWAWANEQSGLPANIIQQSLQLKKYGDDNGIDLLTNSSFDFNEQEMHLIGLIAAGIFNTSGYYIADYGQGAMVVTITSNIIDDARKDHHHRIPTVFPQLISLFDMNHKEALTAYLNAKKYTVSINNDQVTGNKDGNTITAKFDTLNRLTQLNG